ncbi:MAG: aromatic hydrocarbon degradation protein [Magnetococcales bacterium]|nr:aromatic hydrocarbon degradation protein [Magnetococcales bacterium]
MSVFKKSLYVASAFAFVAPVALGAGFQLKEQSGSLQGLSFAGASAKADDASVMFYNPAGITRLKGTQGHANLSLIKPSAKFNNDASGFTAAAVPAATAHTVNDGEGGDAGSLAAIPAIYAVSSMDNGVRYGLAINTPYGLKTEYNDDWVGRYYAIKSELMTINVAPTVAWKVNEEWSLGAALNIQYAEAELTNATRLNNVALADALTTLKGNDLGFGFRVGTMYEPTDSTRIGLAYQSGIHHKLEGDVKTILGSTLIGAASTDNAEAKLRTPDVASLGVYHKLNDRLAVMGELAWTNWSVFENLTVVNSDTGSVLSNVEEKWDDSYFMALGMEYNPCNCPNKRFQFGVAYDQTPVDDEYRTFRIPDEDRLWVSFGYGQEWGEDKSFTVGYSHIFVDDASVVENASSTAKGVVSGSFDASVDILSANFKMKF